MRRDVARNRARLLEAARTVAAQHGPDAPLDDIARAAGVSRTTLHRHFADREALAAAVLEENVESIEARARELADQPDGAVRLFHHVLDIQVESPWLAQMVGTGRNRGLSQLADRTRAAFEVLLGGERGQRCLRSGATSEDALLALPMMMAALTVQRESGGKGSDVRARRMLHRSLFIGEMPDPEL